MVVARQSYALTLWTHWHLLQRERRAWIERRYDRFDLAGMIAAAYHQPGDLATDFQKFYAQVSQRPEAEGDQAVRTERLRKMLDDHRRMRRIEPPPTEPP